MGGRSQSRTRPEMILVFSAADYAVSLARSPSQSSHRHSTGRLRRQRRRRGPAGCVRAEGEEEDEEDDCQSCHSEEGYRDGR